jgi:predicted nucleic acid-binding protein
MRVRLEAEATLFIQEHIRSGLLELVWSYMLDFENAANPFEERRITISGWRPYATLDIEETPHILQHARQFASMGLKAKDALHLACAIAGSCLYFLTTDDGILRRRQDIEDTIIIDPTTFVREVNL